ncbi:T9SS-dependent choice-of-anchor J family protein [Flavobacterium hungaricum]|uniref:T9SS C-terminal target domain-containing protein n=1 Tax=Flavobacterium hungaricum TaxID=2082725 RepID=A0ABR9TRS5_9FLAO|nr:choice-of-anchor J domain-containing protein [Flavobacterium hungaricum]MBE8728069.1 T9SS C-terminal target domain-containing protein [Flavobacterium hungaricum]
MKKLYYSRRILALLCFFGCFSGTILSQTNPAKQPLPYKQNFDNLAANSTSYPAGFQGWLVSASQNTNEYATGLSGDRGLIASSTAAVNSGNIHNYNGKIGFLNTTSADFAIGFAFSSSGLTGVRVIYDAMVIRNPYDGTAAYRLQEMALQYRVGTSGIFKNLPTTAYSNNSTVQQTGAVTTPLNLQTTKITVILPAECDNQDEIQIRWIARLISGTSGSRQSYAIDNIDINADYTAPVNETGFPTAANISATTFNFSEKLNEAGKTYYVLLAGGSAAPTAAQVKAGLDAGGTAALQAGSLDIINAATAYTKNFTGLTASTDYAVFSVAEDIYGNIQTVVNKVDVTTTATALPVISTTVSALDLGLSEINIESVSKSYQIQVSDLANDLAVSVTPNFSISKDNVTFGSTLTYAAADFASNASQTVYVKFNPNLGGAFTGQITHESTAAIAKHISLTGRGINPYIQNFDDPNVLNNSGWTQYDVAGTANKWAYTAVARNVNSGTGAVLMNGFSDSGASKDWLISPKLRLDSFDKLPLLSFYSRKFYAGPSLKLMVSTNYDGVSSPETATWTEIDGNFPSTTGSYVQSQYIELTNYKTDHTYLAWVYETTAGGNNLAAEWSFDDYLITNESGYVASNPVLDFGTVDQNTISASQSFSFKAKGYGDVVVTAPTGYQLSLDNSLFQNSVSLTEADALAGKTLHARFVPTTKEFKISGSLTVTGTSLNKQVGSLTGSSLPKAETFDVVTYNLEFFGAPTSAYGPSDKALQLENVSKVMNKLDADVYVVQEVSSDAQIDALITKINVNGKTFDKATSTSWSYSWDPNSDPSFPPQKLVVLYNTQTTTLKNTRVMFKEFYDDLRSGAQTLANYPGGTSSSFFSSGRLPYMVTLETNVNGVKNEIKFIDLHARANSGSDISRYNMRKYDTQVLKDSLDAHYAASNIILLGDYNDDVKASVITPNPSSYEAFVNDTNNYKALTLEISQAGAYSFLSSGGFLDHITISNELFDQYVAGSTAVYDPRNDIASYTTTTSDHGPVIARFQLKQDVLSTPDFAKNNYYVKAYPNPISDFVSFDVKTTPDRNLKIRLYDINGRAIGSPISVKNEDEISTTVVSVSNLNAGFYFYTVSENNKIIFKDKLVKK